MQHFNRPFISNYGEIPSLINAADGDPWDVLIPGYPRLETSRKFRLKELLGIYKLPDGNHKLIVDIHDRLLHQDKCMIKDEIEKFKAKYEKRTKLHGSIIYF